MYFFRAAKVTPLYLGSSSVTNLTTATASCAVAYPGVSSSGDLLIFTAYFTKTNTTAMTVTTPSGWTLATSQNAVSSAGVYALVYYRIRSSETSVTATASSSTGNFNVGMIQAWSGATVNPTTPINVTASAFSNTAATACTIPTVTTTAANCALNQIVVANNDTNTTAFTYAWTAPPVKQLDTGAAWSTATSYVEESAATTLQATAGATGTFTATASVSAAGIFTANVAIAHP